MNLAVDLTSLSEPWAGMQYYTANFTRALSRTCDGMLTLVADRDEITVAEVDPADSSKFIAGGSLFGSRVLGEQFSLPYALMRSQQPVDRLLVPAYLGPLVTGCAVDMIVYDFLYLKEHGGHGLRDWIYWRGLYKAAFRRASRLYPCSQTTRDEIVDRMPWAEEKIGPVLYPGHRTYQRETTASVSVPADPFILYVGTISPRKNVEELLDFYRDAPSSIRDQYDLRLVGGHGWGHPDPETLNSLEEGIVWEGRVSDARLQRLYEEASLLVLPSRGEGFGMPILEAFRRRLPVVLSPLDVFREVAGEAAWYLPSFEFEEDWIPVVERALKNASERRKKITKGYRRSRRFSWSKSANRYLEDVRTQFNRS